MPELRSELRKIMSSNKSTPNKIKGLIQESKNHKKSFVYKFTTLILLSASIYLASIYLLESFSYHGLVQLILHNAATTISSQIASFIGLSLSPLIISEVIATMTLIIVTFLLLKLIQSTINSLTNANDWLSIVKGKSLMPLDDKSNETCAIEQLENPESKALLYFTSTIITIYLVYAFPLTTLNTIIGIITSSISFMLFTYHTIGIYQTLSLSNNIGTQVNPLNNHPHVESKSLEKQQPSVDKSKHSEIRVLDNNANNGAPLNSDDDPRTIKWLHE